MKVEEVILGYTYSCQICGRDFVCGYTRIEPNWHPVCSRKCNFLAIYRFIQKQEFGAKILELWLKILHLDTKNEEFTLQNAEFRVTKFFINKGLSSVDLIGTRDKTKMRQTNSDNEGTKGQHFPPYEIGGVVPVPVPKFEKNEGTNLVPKTKAGLQKWF